VYRTQETIYAVYAVHDDRVCRFIAMCVNRSDAEFYGREMTGIADVYIMPTSAEHWWRSPIEQPTATLDEGESAELAESHV
jgi:hypothetical protein